MRNKILLTLSSFYIFDSYAGELSYTVKTGDSFSSIIKTTLNKKANFYNTKEFRLAYKKFTLANKHLNNFSKVFPGDKIIIPDEFLLKNQQHFTKYKIKKGDTLRSIVTNWYPTVTSWQVIPVLLKLNPNIKDPNKIYHGQKITIFSTEYFYKKYSAKNKDGLRKIASSPKKPNSLLLQEVWNMSRRDASSFVYIFRKITNSKLKDEFSKYIAQAMNLSRNLEKIHISEFMSQIYMEAQQDTDESYILMLRSFFLDWKRLRSKKHKALRYIE